MKTATITFHAPNNNGSFYQAYALQKVLTNTLGVENEIIDYQSEKQIYQYSVFRPIHSIRDIAKNAVSLLHYRPIKTHNQRFAKSREKYLKMTKRCSTVEETIKVANDYDAVIAGSDQIWNTGAPDFSEAYMLPGVTPRKIAYAISFGSFSNESELQRYRKEIDSFYRISVREDSAQKHLEQQIPKTVSVTIDPTLLLDKEDYIVLTNAEPLIHGDYIFFYSISYPDEVVRAAKRIADQIGMPIITVFTSFHTITCERHGIKVLYDAGPREFINLLSNAKLVLTNSFHGTAFSIVMHKPFYHVCKTVDGKLQRDDRIDNIIEALGIENCNVGINSSVTEGPAVAWETVDRKRHALKDLSLAFLREALTEERQK